MERILIALLMATLMAPGAVPGVAAPAAQRGTGPIKPVDLHTAVERNPQLVKVMTDLVGRAGGTTSIVIHADGSYETVEAGVVPGDAATGSTDTPCGQAECP